jgi:5'-nucleotidase
MNILVVNDDGIDSKGLEILIEAAKARGNVYVSIPSVCQSAMSQGVTIDGVLEINDVTSRLRVHGGLTVNGTAVDALKAGLRLFEEDFDLVLSGVNLGANLALDINYSSTVACCIEAAINNIPAVAFSCDDINASYLVDELNFILDKIIDEKLYLHSKVLNVNFPKLGFPKVLGTKLTVLGKREYHTEFLRINQTNKYNILSSTTHYIESPNSDVTAFEEGFISITPLMIDRSDHNSYKRLGKYFTKE